MIAEKFNSNALHKCNQILLYACSTAVDCNKITTKNSIRVTRSLEITPITMNF